jgi:predicted DCC family thiol-disulfide oxidoreductase YuxK
MTMSQPQILFDGDCAFCRKSVAVLQKLDWLGRFAYINVRDTAQPLLHQAPVVGAPLLEQMHVLTPAGRLYGGYRSIRWLAWRVPLLWPLAPFLYLPGITQLGDYVYRWVARHRFQLVPCQHGACQIKR